MRRATCMFLVLGAGLLAPAGAMAETDAAAIKDAIAGFVTESNSSMEDASLSYEDLTVTPDGDAFDVMITKVVLKSTGDDNFVMELGDASFTVAESGSDYRVSDVSVASTITAVNQTEKESLTLDWTPKRFDGVWSPLLEEFKELDGAIDDITVTFEELDDPGQKVAIAMGDLLLKVATTVNSDTDWDQQSGLQLGPISFEDPEGQGKVTIQQIAADNRITGFDPGSYMEHIQDLMELEKATVANEQERVQSLSDKLAQMDPPARGLAEKLTVSGIDFVDHSPDNASFKLEEAALAITASAPSAQETGTIGLQLTGKGLQLTGESLQGEDLLAAILAPHDWTLDLDLNKLPVAETNRILMELVLTGLGTKNEPQIAFPQIMAAMGQAGSEIVLNKLSLIGDNAELEGTAKATVDPASAIGAVGGATLTLGNVAKLEEALSQLPPELQQEVGGGLVFLKGLGKPETKDGAVIYTYVFDLPADGNVTLNGQPLGALMGGQ